MVINITYAFFETFGIIDTTTQGAPGGATTTLVFKVFQDGFRGADIGGSSAQSVVLMIMVLAPDGDPVPVHREKGALLMERHSSHHTCHPDLWCGLHDPARLGRLCNIDTCAAETILREGLQFWPGGEFFRDLQRSAVC